LLLTRTEFESLIERDVARAVTLAYDTLQAAGVPAGQLKAIYLTGGSSRVPLVHRQLHALGPVATLDDPKTVVAKGALLAAAAERDARIRPHPPRPIAETPETHSPRQVNGSTPPSRNRRPIIAWATAGAAVAALIGLVVWLTVFESNRTAAPSNPVANQSGPGNVPQTVTRTPILGLQFWQNGAAATMSPNWQRGATIVTTVYLKPGPFELRFPKASPDNGIGICAWTDNSIFSIQDGTPVASNQYFGDGRGFADTEYGSGTLFVDNQGFNYLAGHRVAAFSSDTDKVDFTQTGHGAYQDIPLQQQKTDLYLTLFIQKTTDATFHDNTELEYVVLHFAP
jgi:hypothetical protein